MNAPTAHYTPEVVLAGEKIVSSDSHIIEPDDLWLTNLPSQLKDRYPKFPKRNSPGEKPGGSDPHARIGEMETDGVSAEVLYPTLGLRLFAMEDAECQEACFQIANDWMIDYCKVHPGRLFGRGKNDRLTATHEGLFLSLLQDVSHIGSPASRKGFAFVHRR